MSPLATILCAAMISCGVVGVWTASRMRRGRVEAVLADAIMLAAMIDVCVLGARMLAPVVWAALLLCLALVALALARRSSPTARRPVAAHALGLIVTAVTVLMLGSAHGSGMPAHHGAPGLLVGAVVLASVAHVGLAVAQLRALDAHRRDRRTLRVSAAAAGTSAMAALAVLSVM